ncbi:histidinol-phosphate transaminase [Bacillus songklensis]|uniref:Histidinol-phosphate aminotransferase n=1 Tax=Bacillus songklensis TaxID=1069116 RepID=A0ABV8B1L4_9BACI
MLQPYKPGKSPEQIKKEYNVDKVIKLASNENPFGCSPKVESALQNSLQLCATYPDGAATELRKKLSEHLQVKENQLLFGSGLDEVIQTISRVMLCEGDNIVTALETFPQYKHHAIIEGCEVREIPLINGRYDLDTMSKAIDLRTRVVWICNPNNPTGTYVKEEALIRFLRTIPRQTIVVLDEAYYEYVNAKDFPQTIPLLNEFENLLVLRTFSKAYGLAAFRIGYAIGNEQLIEKINIARLPFNTSTFAQAAAIAALEDHPFLDFCVEQNKQGLQQYEECLEELGIEYCPSQTNFIFIRTDDSNAWFEHLIEKGYIVRPFPTGIRITIGTKEQNEGVLSIIRNHVTDQTLVKIGDR